MTESMATIAPMVTHPMIVIGVPCYNEQTFLADALVSLQQQSWSDFAVLISDNASTDRTGEIARAFCERDPRFHYYRQPENIGSARNFNFTTDHSDSRYILWLGAHDLLAPTMLDYHVSQLERRPELSVSQSAHAWINERHQIVETTNDEDLDGGGANDPARYLRSIGANKYNVGCNSVIRRSMLGDRRFTGVVGTDRVLLSHLAFRGPFATTQEALYLRRTFDDRSDHPYMERLTGRAGAAQNWTALAEEYDRDFAGLLGHCPKARALRRKLDWRLRYYLPVKRTSALTRGLWTARRLRKLAAMALGRRSS